MLYCTGCGKQLDEGGTSAGGAGGAGAPRLPARCLKALPKHLQCMYQKQRLLPAHRYRQTAVRPVLMQRAV